jgi:hypothetical protein
MAGSDTTMMDANTVIRRENALILSSDKDKQVTQYPTSKGNIFRTGLSSVWMESTKSSDEWTP